jgi:F-type H+-transporting ATPase subunit gamma
MTQNIEKIYRRKENIETIDPLLSALRTISLSNWRSSLNRNKNLKSYIDELESAHKIAQDNSNIEHSHENSQKKILYIIGSNRGLCGNFNKNIYNWFFQENLFDKDKLDIIIIGKRLSQIFKQANLLFTNTMDFPDIKNIQDFVISLSSSDAVNFQQPSVSVLFNQYVGASKYITTLQNIFPREGINLNTQDTNSCEFIIDTDPLLLIRTIESILFNSHLQLCLLSSLASESSTRFSIMESAGRNVDDLINELEIIVQDHRRGKITTETQELAISSGLLKSDK